MDRRLKMPNKSASAGHKLGQLIGDWYEAYFVLPLLQQVGRELDLFVDSRLVERAARTGKIIWKDIDGNSTDYDYVLELGGTKTQRGVPVAFIECFWRRGSRHSKDKARDDSGKLLPMRESYPTARFLGIVAAGDFTKPARALLKSKEIDLFYIPKDKIIRAFSACGLIIDYPDKLPEEQKAKIVEDFASSFTDKNKIAVQLELYNLIGKATIASYVDRVRATLSSLPQEIRLVLQYNSQPLVFELVEKTAIFLNKPEFNMNSPITSYLYQVTYSDGSEFERTVKSIKALKKLHKQMELLNRHMNSRCA
jgi:hypothetical protein